MQKKRLLEIYISILNTDKVSLQQGKEDEFECDDVENITKR